MSGVRVSCEVAVWCWAGMSHPETRFLVLRATVSWTEMDVWMPVSELKNQ